jgi:hypothetical protein
MKSGIFEAQRRENMANSNPRLQIQRMDLKALISWKAIHPFIVRNWRKATRGQFGSVKKCAQ